VVESRARTNEAEAHGLLKLASKSRDRNSGAVRRDADELVRLAENALDRIAHPGRAALAALPGCRVLECEALNVSSDASVELVFTTEAVFVRSGDRDRVELDGSEINRIEIEELFPPSSA
jgi:hypothetical protein